jgi:hypothetical protein
MGRGTAGVKGMNVSDKGNSVLSLDVVDPKDKSGELLVVTENGYGKRTRIADYPVKGRGTKGVLTAKLTAKKGGLAGGRVVREGEELLFISQSGMVQRNAVQGISRMGRATQGVRVMNLKSGDRVSAVALVVESTNAEAPAADLAAEEAEAEAEVAEKGEIKVAGEGAEADGKANGRASKRSRAAAPTAKPKPKAPAKPKAAPKKKAPAKKKAAGAKKTAKKPAAKSAAAKPTAKRKPKLNPGTVRQAQKRSAAKRKKK